MSTGSLPPDTLENLTPRRRRQPFPTVPDAALPPAARRWSPITRYIWHRIYVRFTTFQATCPDTPLSEQLAGFVAGLSPGMAKDAFRALRTKYRREVDWDDVPHRRWAPRNEARLQAGLLDRAEDRARLRAGLTTPRERAIVECLWTLRRAEVCALTWGDVDLSRAVVYVYHGKGDKSAMTLLIPEAVAALRELYAATGRPAAESPVFPNRVGEAIHPMTLDEWMRRRLRALGLYRPGRSCHAFRRTMATLYWRKHPGDIRGLQKLLRHENIATTARYMYVQAEELAPRLAEAFGHNGNGGGHAL